MDVEKVVASWPILRRIWRWMPKPLRYLVMAVSAVFLWRRWRRSDEPATPEGISRSLEDGSPEDVEEGREPDRPADG